MEALLVKSQDVKKCLKISCFVFTARYKHGWTLRSRDFQVFFLKVWPESKHDSKKFVSRMAVYSSPSPFTYKSCSLRGPSKHVVFSRKYPLHRYTLGVLTHITSWDQNLGSDETLM